MILHSGSWECSREQDQDKRNFTEGDTCRGTCQADKSDMQIRCHASGRWQSTGEPCECDASVLEENYPELEWSCADVGTLQVQTCAGRCSGSSGFRRRQYRMECGADGAWRKSPPTATWESPDCGCRDPSQVDPDSGIFWSCPSQDDDDFWPVGTTCQGSCDGEDGLPALWQIECARGNFWKGFPRGDGGGDVMCGDCRNRLEAVTIIHGRLVCEEVTRGTATATTTTSSVTTACTTSTTATTTTTITTAAAAAATTTTETTTETEATTSTTTTTTTSSSTTECDDDDYEDAYHDRCNDKSRPKSDGVDYHDDDVIGADCLVACDVGYVPWPVDFLSCRRHDGSGGAASFTSSDPGALACERPVALLMGGVNDTGAVLRDAEIYPGYEGDDFGGAATAEACAKQVPELPEPIAVGFAIW